MRDFTRTLIATAMYVRLYLVKPSHISNDLNNERRCGAYWFWFFFRQIFFPLNFFFYNNPMLLTCVYFSDEAKAKNENQTRCLVWFGLPRHL